MLSILVRRVTGKSLRVYADEVLFQPLGMRNTHFHDNRAELVANRVLPYASAGPNFRIEGDTADSLVPPQAPTVVGDGNLFTTADDLLGWAKYLEGPAGEELAVAGKLSDGTALDYAFGLVRLTSPSGIPFLAHGGNNGGYRAAIVHYPSEKLTVGVYCNHGGMEPQSISLDVAALYLPPDPPPRADPAPVSGSTAPAPTAADVAPPADLPAFAGRYCSSELDGAQEITHATGILRLVSRTAEGELRPSGKDRFTWSSWVFSFTRDATGHVVGYTLDGTRAVGLQFSRITE